MKTEGGGGVGFFGLVVGKTLGVLGGLGSKKGEGPPSYRPVKNILVLESSLSSIHFVRLIWYILKNDQGKFLSKAC